MDIYITEKNSGKRIALSMLPEKAKIKGSTKFISWDVISIGEIKSPSGMKLKTFSWNGVLPGESKKAYSFIKSQHWKSPKELASTFERWQKNGTRLILMITETAVNNEVYLSEFAGTYTGGYGDIEYDIAFIEAKDMIVRTMSEVNKKPPNGATSNTVRPPSPAASSKKYTVQKGDCLWTVAQRFLNDGSQYEKIYQLNKKLIDDRNRGTGLSKYTIYVGQVLVLP